MSNIKEQIRQEIERLYDSEAPKHDQQCEFEDGYFTGIATISKFIDSLSEEKPSEDFPTSDEEVAKFLATHPKVEVPEKYKTPNWLFDKQPSDDLEAAAEKYADGEMMSGLAERAFIAGGEWRKQQMMKEAVDGKVFMSFAPGHNQMVMADVDLPTNTKVKLIIVKQDD